MDVVNADIAGANICPYSRPAGRNDSSLIKLIILPVLALVENTATRGVMFVFNKAYFRQIIFSTLNCDRALFNEPHPNCHPHQYQQSMAHPVVLLNT